MYSRFGALSVPFVPVLVSRYAWVDNRYFYASPQCRTSQLWRIFIPHSASVGTILVSACLMVWDWLVLRAISFLFFGPRCSLPFCFPLSSLSHLSFWELNLWGWGFGLIGCIIDPLLPSLSMSAFKDNINYHLNGNLTNLMCNDLVFAN